MVEQDFQQLELIFHCPVLLHYEIQKQTKLGKSVIRLTLICLARGTLTTCGSWNTYHVVLSKFDFSSHIDCYIIFSILPWDFMHLTLSIQLYNVLWCSTGILITPVVNGSMYAWNSSFAPSAYGPPIAKHRRCWQNVKKGNGDALCRHFQLFHMELTVHFPWMIIRLAKNEADPEAETHVKVYAHCPRWIFLCTY